MEQPPHQQAVQFNGKYYTIWLPWLYYRMQPAINTDEYIRIPHPYYYGGMVGRLQCSPTQATAKHHWLTNAPLPNMYAGRPCYYRFGTMVYPKQEQTVEAMVSGITTWWEANSNLDGPLYLHRTWAALCGRVHSLPVRKEYAKVLREWEKLSLKEVKKLPWPRHRTRERFLQT